MTLATSPGAELVDPGQRGRLVVNERVVAKIATRVVAEMDRATGVPRSLLGLHLGATTDDTPARVDARVYGDVVTVSVTMSVHYPAPVGQVTRQARRYVRDRVGQLTGLRVAEVDISVPALVTPPPARRVV